MIEKIQLDDVMINALDDYNSRLRGVRGLCIEDCEQLSYDTVKKIVDAILEEYYKKIGGAGIKEDYIKSAILSSVRELMFEKDEDLRTFISRASSIIDGCIIENRDLMAAYMIEKLNDNVKDYTSGNEKKSTKKTVSAIVSKIANHIAVHKAYNTEYKNMYQQDFESIIKSIVEKEINNYQTQLNDQYQRVYLSVNELTHNIISYFYPMIEKHSENYDELAKLFK